MRVKYQRLLRTLRDYASDQNKTYQGTALRHEPGGVQPIVELGSARGFTEAYR